MKLLRIIMFVCILLTPALISAQEGVKEELTIIENERTQKVEQALLLNLPEISDNPNHIITFKDPSGKGVSLEIDGQGFETIKSPHTLPSLGLGKHILTFKFADEEGTEQILERNFTVIPRPPVLNPPTIVDNEIKISGSAISNAQIEVFLSKEIVNQKDFVKTDENGNWEIVFSENIEEGIYTVIASVRRNGFSSNYSEPVVFNVGQDQETTIVEKEIAGIAFSFQEAKDFEKLKQNPELLIAFGAFFTLGALLSTIVISLVGRLGQKKSKKVLQELLKKNTDGKETSSFKEKFEQNKKVEENTEEVEEVESEIEQEDEQEDVKTLTKEEFMKKFEEFDPDDDEGKEKKVKVSLTSAKD